jgi:RNA polymerase sigma-70 factor (ECF subfamily)
MRDGSEFDVFYDATVRRVVTEVYAMVGDLAEAEDAVQEAYARAWQRWSSLAQYDDPVAWVRTVAYRIAVSSWRRMRNRRTAHALVAVPEATAELSQEVLELTRALRQIPAAQRRAIVLHHLVGLSVNEVAEQTHASVSAVKQRLSRGRQALALLLDNGHSVEEVSHLER